MRIAVVVVLVSAFLAGCDRKKSGASWCCPRDAEYEMDLDAGGDAPSPDGGVDGADAGDAQ